MLRNRYVKREDRKKPVSLPDGALILGHLKIVINFPFETNGKLMILGVPVLNHCRVCSLTRVFALSLHITEDP